MKHLATTLFLIWSLLAANAQVPTWNIQPPVTITSPFSLQFYGDHLLVYGQKTIVEFDQLGIITAWQKTPVFGAYAYGSFFREKTDILTGEPYFLVSYTTNTGPTGMQVRISEYHPGSGFKNEKILPEANFGFSTYPIISRNDSVLFILGKQYLRQVTHHADHSVAIDWEKTHTLGDPVDAAFTEVGVVGISTQQIFALDALGNTLWSKTAPSGLRRIVKIQGGFLVCGQDFSVTPNLAILTKFTTDGNTVWSKTFPDQTYRSLLVEPDGSITVSGESETGQATLHHLDKDGNSLWQKFYQPGLSTAVSRAPDGGYVLAGKADYGGLFIIKTDALGNTSALRTDPFPTWGSVENSLLKTRVSPSGNLFQTYFNEAPAFVVPKADSTSLFLLAAPWISGQDPDDSLHLAADTYIHSEYGSDYRAGFSHTAPTDLRRVWTISKTDLDNLQQDWQDNGMINSIIPYDILTWPAKGNENFKQNIDFTKVTIDKNALSAPFVDRNGDGKYSVYDGDYPRIKGDQMAWWVLTDSTFHYNTFSRPLILDLSVSVYAYDCPLQAQMKQSLFADFEFINRSGIPYKNVFAGLWSIPGLGCPADDYIGSLPAVNAFYVYNQDSIDGYTGTSCYATTYVPGFGHQIPVGSISFTNVQLNKFISYYSSDVQPLPPVGRREPHTAEEYAHYLQGKWADGTALTYDGQPINHDYAGNPADPGSNSMCQNGNNVAPGNRYMNGSHGPFDFAPNDTFQLQVAFTYHSDIPLPCPDIYGTVQHNLEELHDLVNSGALDPPAHLPALSQLLSGQTVMLDATVPGATAYLWSNGATTPVISVHQPGAYSVTITRITGCSSTELALVQGPTATENPEWIGHLRIFPNPSAGLFQIKTDAEVSDRLDIQLFNTMGQLLRSQTAEFQAGLLDYQADYRDLANGLYLLQLRSGEKTRTIKLILQH